jgi:integrase
MNPASEKELLNFAIQNGIIDINTIQKQIEMNERKKYLDMHNSKIWQSTDKKWYTYIDDATKPNGKKLIKRRTKEEIDDCLVEYYKQYVEPQSVLKTYREWIDKKLKFGEISKQTADRYDNEFKKYFSDIENKEIRFITEDFLDDFILEQITKHNLKSKAWSNLRTIIRGVFLFAKKKGYTSISIVTYLAELDLSKKIFNHEKKADECVIYSQKEVSKMLQHICGSKSLNDIAILFAMYTGMRVGEIVALKWEDINNDFIHVNRTQIRYNDDCGKIIHEIRDFPKTEAGIRDVVIVPELRSVIKRLRSINPFTEYLFEKNGECIHKHSVCTRLYNLCDRFGFERKGMHAIRRYYITKLIDAGVEESIIIHQVGHTDFKTTKNHYYKNNKEKDYISAKVTLALGG